MTPLSIPRRLLPVVATIIGMFLISIFPVLADDIVPGHVLVRVQPGVDAKRLADDFSVTIRDHASNTNLYSFSVPQNSTEPDFAARLSRDSRVISAEPDRYVVSPEVGGEPFHFAFDLNTRSAAYVNAASYVQVNVGRPTNSGRGKASPVPATGKGIIVAVLDTGVTLNHPDLKSHLLPGFNAIHPGTPPADLPDGIVNYEVGHGTMVTGIIARLAPDAWILPVRVLNGDGSGTILDLVKGIRYATAHGASVINMSFGCSVKVDSLKDALDDAEKAGVILVASAGNDNVDKVESLTVTRGTLTVAAVDANNTKSPFSNYGSFIHVSAPGSNIHSTYWRGGYASWSGTSFAAPFVSAEAALILSVRPDIDSGHIKNLIRDNTRSIDASNPNYRGRLGKGIIDIDASVKAAMR